MPAEALISTSVEVGGTPVGIIPVDIGTVPDSGASCDPAPEGAACGTSYCRGSIMCAVICDIPDIPLGNFNPELPELPDPTSNAYRCNAAIQLCEICTAGETGCTTLDNCLSSCQAAPTENIPPFFTTNPVSGQIGSSNPRVTIMIEDPSPSSLIALATWRLQKKISGAWNNTLTFGSITDAINNTRGSAVVVLPGVGEYRFQLVGKDQANNTTSTFSNAFQVVDNPVDTTPPTVTANPTSQTAAGTIFVALTPEDTGGSGLSQARYVMDGSVSLGSGIQFQSTTNISIASAGSHTINWIAQDNAGNIASGQFGPYTVTASTGSDCTLNASIVGPAEGVVSQNLAFAASVSSTGTGCSGSIQHTWDFGDGSTIPAGNNPGVSHVYTSGGNKTLVLRVTQGTSATTATKLVKINATSLNGVCGTAVNQYFSTEPTQNLCEAGNSTKPTALGNGAWSWSCQGLNGGQTATCQSQTTGSGDVTAPSVTFTPNGGSWSKNSQTVTVNVTDTQSNIQAATWQVQQFNGTSWRTVVQQGSMTTGNQNTSQNITLNGIGQYRIYVYVQDSSNNENFVYSLTYDLNTGAQNGSCGSAARTYLDTETKYTGSFCLVGTANPATPAFPANGATTGWTCQGVLGGNNTQCSASRDSATNTIWQGNLHNSAYGQDMGWLLVGNPAGTAYEGMYNGLRIEQNPLLSGGSQYRITGNAYSPYFGIFVLDAATVNVISPQWAVIQGSGRFPSAGINLVTASGNITPALCEGYKNFGLWPANPGQPFAICIDLSTVGTNTPLKMNGYAWSDTYGWLKVADDGGTIQNPPVYDNPVAGSSYQMTTTWNPNLNINGNANQNGNNNINQNTNSPVTGKNPLVTINATPDYVIDASNRWDTSAQAIVSCKPGSGTSCDTASYKIAVFPSNPGSCPQDYALYTIDSPMLVGDNLWVCGAAHTIEQDKSGNFYYGYSTDPVQFRVDTIAPDCSSEFPPSGQYYSQIILENGNCSDSGSGIEETGIQFGYGESFETPFTDAKSFPKEICREGDSTNCYTILSDQIALPSDDFEGDKYQNSFAVKARDRVGNETFVPLRYNFTLIAPLIRYYELKGSLLRLYGTNFGRSGMARFYDGTKQELENMRMRYSSSDGKKVEIQTTRDSRVRYIRIQRNTDDRPQETEISLYFPFSFVHNADQSLTLLPSAVTALPGDTVTLIASMGPETAQHIFDWQIPYIDPQDQNKGKISDSPLPELKPGNNVFTLQLKDSIPSGQYPVVVKDILGGSTAQIDAGHLYSVIFSDTSNNKRLALLQNRDIDSGDYGTGDIGTSGSTSMSTNTYMKTTSSNGTESLKTTSELLNEGYSPILGTDGNTLYYNRNTGDVVRTETTNISTDGKTTIQPSCGSSNNQTFETAPTQNLCLSGAPTTVTLNGTTWGWSCIGTNESKVSCSAAKTATTQITTGLNTNGNQSQSNQNAGTKESQRNTNTNGTKETCTDITGLLASYCTTNPTDTACYTTDINTICASFIGQTGTPLSSYCYAYFNNPSSICPLTSPIRSGNNGETGGIQNINTNGSLNLNQNSGTGTSGNANNNSSPQNQNTNSPGTTIPQSTATAVITVINPDSTDTSKYMSCWGLPCNAVIVTSAANEIVQDGVNCGDATKQRTRALSESGITGDQQAGEPNQICLSDLYLGTEKELAQISATFDGSPDLQFVLELKGDQGQVVTYAVPAEGSHHTFGEKVNFTGFKIEPTITITRGTLSRVLISLDNRTDESVTLTINDTLASSQTNQCSYISTGYCYQMCYTTVEANGNVTAHVRGDCPATAADTGPISIADNTICRPDDTSAANTLNCQKIERYCTNLCREH